MDSETTPINSLPTELLQYILQSLPIVELMRCRGVCRSWRALVDAFSDETWRRFCARDHPEQHDKARTKSSPDLTWKQLYRSLHMWTKLDAVDEYNWIELIRYRKRRIVHGVCGVKTFNGQLIVLEDDKILYYDSDGEKTGEFDTELHQVKFDETDSLIVYIGNRETTINQRVSANSELRVIKKVNGVPDLDGTIVIPNVQNFIIVGNIVYYDIMYKLNNNKSKETTICQCRAKDNYSSMKLKTFPGEVVTYGYNKDRVNVLLESNDIYVLEDGEFVQRDRVTFSNNMEMARKYNLEPSEEFLYSISCSIDLVINSYCFYGKFTFLGCNDTTVKVYDTEKLLDDPFLVFDSPLEEFDLYEWLRPVHKVWRNVTGVDVMEKEDGHIIIASIPKGAYAIELTHKCMQGLPGNPENQEQDDKTVEFDKENIKEEFKRKKRRCM